MWFGIRLSKILLLVVLGATSLHAQEITTPGKGVGRHTVIVLEVTGTGAPFNSVLCSPSNI